MVLEHCEDPAVLAVDRGSLGGDRGVSHKKRQTSS